MSCQSGSTPLIETFSDVWLPYFAFFRVSAILLNFARSGQFSAMSLKCSGINLILCIDICLCFLDSGWWGWMKSLLAPRVFISSKKLFSKLVRTEMTMATEATPMMIPVTVRNDRILLAIICEIASVIEVKQSRSVFVINRM